LTTQGGKVDIPIKELRESAILLLEEADVCCESEVTRCDGQTGICGYSAVIVTLSCVMAFGEILLRDDKRCWDWTHKDGLGVRRCIDRFHKEMAKVDIDWVSNLGDQPEVDILVEIRNGLSHLLSLPTDVVLLSSFENPPPENCSDRVIIVPKRLVDAVRDTIEGICRDYPGVVIENVEGTKGFVSILGEAFEGAFTVSASGAPAPTPTETD
jgi:hypothetical protein